MMKRSSGGMRLAVLTLVVVGGSASGLTLGAAEATTTTTPEPVLMGRPLSYWVAQAGDRRQEPLERVIAVLAQAVQTADSNRRVQAADTLTRLGPQAKAAAPALATLLDHDQAWVSNAGQEALAAIGRDAVPVVAQAFQQGNARVQLRAALVLGVIGPDAREALPVLEDGRHKATGELRGRLDGIIAAIRGAGGGVAGAASSGKPAVAAIPVAAAAGTSDDWPQFHGPRRDGRCTETGLLASWPEGGPPLLRKLTGLGRGYSTVSIAGGRLFTMGDRRESGGEESQYALAYDLATLRPLWSTRVGPPNADGGPRCTPTIVDGRAYVLGTEGDLACLDVADGHIVWQKSVVKDLGGRMMSTWKFSESPLVDGPRVIVTPGGPEAGLVALDRKTGAPLWKCALPPLGDKGKDGAGYASAVVAEIAGVRQYVQLLGRGVVGVEADTGRFLWGYNRIANSVANITAPLVLGDYVFTTTSYKTGAALLHITRQGERFSAAEVYFLNPKQFENHHGGVVLAGEYLYGGSGQNKGVPVCLKLSTGAIAWTGQPPANGSAGVLLVEGGIIFRYDRGLVALIAATPEEFRVKSSFMPLLGAGPAWAHPVVHAGRLYLRHGDVLGCYDLRATPSDRGGPQSGR